MEISAQAFAAPQLAEGEVYVGVVTEDGKIESARHVILLPGDNGPAQWADAKAWAAKQGGELPTRMELLLLFKTQRGAFKERAYWSGEEFAGYDAYAWGQSFYGGLQGSWHKAIELRARAVRRVII